MSTESDKLSIKNLTFVRNFLDFNSDKLLNKKTAVYAPNGSGKTNLSRLIQAAKDKQLDLDDLKSDEADSGDTLQFKLLVGAHEINESNYINDTENALLGRVQVFNSDFVDKNINTPNFSDHDVSGEVKVELGDAEEKLKKAEKKKKALAEQQTKAYDALVKIASDMKDRLIKVEKKYSGNDLNIWKELNVAKIITAEFELDNQYVAFLKKTEQVEKYKTCETDFTDVKSVSDDDKLTFSQTRINLPDFDAIANELVTPATLPEVDKQTETNLKFLHGWLHNNIAYGKSADDIIKSAIELSEQKDRNKCILCKRTLDDGAKALFGSYKKYYKGEKAKYESRLSAWVQELDSVNANLSGLDDTLKGKNEQFCKLFSIENTWVNIDAEDIKTKIQACIDQLKDKISNPAKPLTLDLKIKDTLHDVNKHIETNRKLCEKVNTNIKNSQTRASQLRTLIGQKYLYDILVGHEGDIDRLVAFKGEIATINGEIEGIRNNLPSQRVRDSIKKLFNTFLHKRVGIDKYEVDIIDERIVLKLLNRNISEKTQRISEGEKVMIGLCYFFASCISSLNEFEKFKDAIFVIDDPVSSTSYGNFFGISSLINHFEEDIRKGVWPHKTGDINVQKIILTHNTQFFNLIQAHIFKNKANSQYLMLKDDCFVVLDKNARLSEFQTAMLRVYEYSKGSAALNIGNDIRRIIETFKHFYGLNEFDEKTVTTIFHYANQEKLGSFYTLIQHTSHLTPEESSDPLPPEIMQNGVNQFIELIEHDKSPFKQAWAQIRSLGEE